MLPVFVGRATRAVEFASEGQKEYLAGLRLGLVTDTQDTSGTVLEEMSAAVTPGELEAVLPRFRGPIQQIPPMYSAIKIQGKKLYELGQKGPRGRAPPDPSPSTPLTVEEVPGPDRFLARVRCPRAPMSAPSVTTSARPWAAAGPCSPLGGAPWPPGILSGAGPSPGAGPVPPGAPIPAAAGGRLFSGLASHHPPPRAGEKGAQWDAPPLPPAQRRESTGSMERTAASLALSQVRQGVLTTVKLLK